MFLKLIALLAMVIDHVGYLLNVADMRLIGRISFPIYAYLIGKGCLLTKKPEKRVLKLLITAVFSLPIYCTLFDVPDYNVLNIVFVYTFFSFVVFLAKKYELRPKRELVLFLFFCAILTGGSIFLLKDTGHSLFLLANPFLYSLEQISILVLNGIDLLILPLLYYAYNYLKKKTSKPFYETILFITALHAFYIVYLLVTQYTGFYLDIEYGLYGFLVIYIFYQFKNLFLVAFAFIALNLFYYYDFKADAITSVQFFSILSLLFILPEPYIKQKEYNRPKNFFVKNLFYIMYPLHLLILLILKNLFHWGY